MPVTKYILFTGICYSLWSFLLINSEPYGILLNGYKVKSSYSFGTDSPLQLKECGMECFLRSECLSITFQMSKFKCYWNSVNVSDSKNFATKKGYMSSDILTWDLGKSKLGNCFSRPCPARTRCTHLTKGGHVCILTECVEAPAFPPNVKQNFQRRIGMTITYKCMDNYTAYGSPTKIKCKADGTWAIYNPSFYCAWP